MELASIDSLQDPNDRPVVTSYAGPLTLYFHRHTHTHTYALIIYVLTNTYMNTHIRHTLTPIKHIKSSPTFTHLP
jgi:hypothetical protein